MLYFRLCRTTFSAGHKLFFLFAFQLDPFSPFSFSSKLFLSCLHFIARPLLQPHGFLAHESNFLHLLLPLSQFVMYLPRCIYACFSCAPLPWFYYSVFPLILPALEWDGFLPYTASRGITGRRGETGSWSRFQPLPWNSVSASHSSLGLERIRSGCTCAARRAWGALREWNILPHPRWEARVQPGKRSLLGTVRASSTFNAEKIFRDFELRESKVF